MSDVTELPHDVERKLREDDSGDYRRRLIRYLETLREGLFARQRGPATSQDHSEVRAALVAVEHSIRALQLISSKRSAPGAEVGSIPPSWPTPRPASEGVFK